MATAYGTSTVAGRSRIAVVMNGILAALRYIFFFVWVVDFARWLVTTGGNIAESAFLLATVYVTINTVAHQLVIWLLPEATITLLNQIAVICFSVLPELIIFAAIKVTYDHFKMAFSTKRIDAWTWAILYILPTIVFLILTIITISSFVSVEATTTATTPQATGAMLVTRCLAGWSYGMLQMLWSRLGSEGYSTLFARLRAQIADFVATVAARDLAISDLQMAQGVLQEQVKQLDATVAARDTSISELRAAQGVLQEQVRRAGLTLELRENMIATLQAQAEELKERNSTLDTELADTRLTLAAATRKRQSDNSPDTDEIEAVEPVAVNSRQYQLVKEHVQAAILRGEKVNMRKVATESGVSYNTVRRHAQPIIDEFLKHVEKLHIVHAEQESA